MKNRKSQIEDWETAIEKEFKDCLKSFPELKREKIGLIINHTCADLSGAEGWRGEERVVILNIPTILQDKPKALRPIIFHELSHLIDLKNPDRVFMERADEKSKKMWELLQANKTLKCEVIKK